MRFFRQLGTTGVCVCFLASIATGQTAGLLDATATVSDGAVTLQGTFNQLAGIEAKSAGSHLSLSRSQLGNHQSPIFGARAVVVQDLPNSSVVGVLGASNRVDLEGTNRTSILYAATEEVALAGDLEINVAIGNCRPLGLDLGNPLTATCVHQQWQDGTGNTGGGDTGGGDTGGGNESPGFKLIDGEIYLVGDFQDLGSVEISSANGNLSLGTVSAGVLDYAPFTGRATLLEVPDGLIIGALGASSRVDIQGETRTVLTYSDTVDVAKTDLAIQIGLGDGGPEPVPVGAIDELAGRGVTIQDGFITFVGRTVVRDRSDFSGGKCIRAANGASRYKAVFCTG